MIERLIEWLIGALRAIRGNFRWMTWNLFLAFIPLVLSYWLFRRSRKRSLIWWLGLLTFLAFLPNAPYLLTDIIHFVQDIRNGYSIWVVTLAIIPIYTVVILGGFEAYVLSLINLGYYLRQEGLRRFILPSELVLHGLSAVGIYLGRFKRFNSWDFVTQPDALANSVLEDLAGKRPILVMIVAFLIITSLYWIMKQVSLGIILRRQEKQKQTTYQSSQSERTPDLD